MSPSGSSYHKTNTRNKNNELLCPEALGKNTPIRLMPSRLYKAYKTILYKAMKLYYINLRNYIILSYKAISYKAKAILYKAMRLYYIKLDVQ